MLITKSFGVVGPATPVVTSKSIVLCSAFTPVVPGPDSSQIEIPYDVDGVTSLSWSLTRLSVYLTPGTGLSYGVAVEKISPIGKVTVVGIAKLGAGVPSVIVTTKLGTAVSGDRLRLNFSEITGATNWTVIVGLVNPPE